MLLDHFVLPRERLLELIDEAGREAQVPGGGEMSTLDVTHGVPYPELYLVAPDADYSRFDRLHVNRVADGAGVDETLQMLSGSGVRFVQSRPDVGTITLLLQCPARDHGWTMSYSGAHPHIASFTSASEGTKVLMQIIGPPRWNMEYVDDDGSLKVHRGCPDRRGRAGRTEPRVRAAATRRVASHRRRRARRAWSCRAATDLHARSLELWDHTGIADRIVDAALPITGVPLFSHGRQVARLDFGGVDSVFPAAVSLPQHDLEDLLCGFPRWWRRTRQRCRGPSARRRAAYRYASATRPARFGISSRATACTAGCATRSTSRSTAPSIRAGGR